MKYKRLNRTKRVELVARRAAFRGGTTAPRRLYGCFPVVVSRWKAVPVGATFVVRPGERVPLDGEVFKGIGDVNQAAITGEASL